MSRNIIRNEWGRTVHGNAPYFFGFLALAGLEPAWGLLADPWSVLISVYLLRPSYGLHGASYFATVQPSVSALSRAGLIRLPPLVWYSFPSTYILCPYELKSVKEIKRPPGKKE